MTKGTPEAEIQELKRALLFYRLVVVVILVGTIALSVWYQASSSSPYGYAGEVWTVDLNERVKATEDEFNEYADHSESFFVTEYATVHMHYMGHAQTTPMHLHPDSDEASIIAGGKAEVEALWGEAGQVRTATATHERGALIANDRLTAHEFRNLNSDRMLANLVFTMPRFGGNFYVHADDPRILGAPAPYTANVANDLPAFTASKEPFRLVGTPALRGHMSELLVATTWTLPANSGKPVVAYVAAGEGDVDGKPLAPNTFAQLESKADIVVTAKPGAPLVVILFDPLGALPTTTP